jgi:hypothetical protein
MDGELLQPMARGIVGRLAGGSTALLSLEVEKPYFFHEGRKTQPLLRFRPNFTVVPRTARVAVSRPRSGGGEPGLRLDQPLHQLEVAVGEAER